MTHVSVTAEATRAYPHPEGVLAPHVLGYLAPGQAEELQGRTGLEEQYDAFTRGAAQSLLAESPWWLAFAGLGPLLQEAELAYNLGDPGAAHREQLLAQAAILVGQMKAGGVLEGDRDFRAAPVGQQRSRLPAGGIGARRQRAGREP